MAVTALTFVILIGASLWVYDDAKKRNMESAVMWAVLTFAILIIGLPFYLWERKKYPIIEIDYLKCNNCGEIFDSFYDFCPFCGDKQEIIENNQDRTFLDIDEKPSIKKEKSDFFSFGIITIVFGFISSGAGYLFNYNLSIYIGVFLIILGCILTFIK